jgi:hypothetical protein
MKITEALRVQLDVQRRLHEQLEVCSVDLRIEHLASIKNPSLDQIGKI